MIDLRSDTVTKPSDAMRSAMASAMVDDDVLGHDPTVLELEQRTAELLGKEAALFVPSGTMANQLAIKTHTVPGDEIIIEADSHIFWYEAGAPAVISGVMCHRIQGDRGVFTADDVRGAIRGQDVHYPQTSLVCVENTHNRGGGKIWPVEQIAEIADVARETGLKMHLDGARLWNASAASGISELDYAAYFDSVAVCFSKGLGAPVGSALAGDAEFITLAKRFRKMFGGGMRQSGIIAAGALFALDSNRSRLADDHANAKRLAEGLAGIDGIEVDPADIETNLVYFGVADGRTDELVAGLEEAGVSLLGSGDSCRAVTNLMVSAADIETTVAAAARIMM
jgi:threonine aldolase